MKKDWMVRESELDDMQLRILQSTLSKSSIVIGSAGSGKSVLALIRAQRLESQGTTNYKVIVYTKALCWFMESGKKDLNLANDFFYHYQWINPNYPRVPYPRPQEHADYFIVDEIQDFNYKEIFEFLWATHKNFFFFGDKAQSIYDGYPQKGATMNPSDIAAYVTQCRGEVEGFNLETPKIFELYYNYRLPLPIAKFSQYIGQNLPEFNPDIYKNPTKDLPILKQFPNPEEQLKAIANYISRNQLDDVAILVIDNKTVKTVANDLKNLGYPVQQKYDDRTNWQNHINDLNFSSSNTVPKVMTYHSAKGLQFETVILPLIGQDDNNKFHEGIYRNALYVAATRAYKQLYIMYSGGLPDVFSHIPSELYKTDESSQTYTQL